MNPVLENRLLMTRRHFFGRGAAGIGAAALGSLLNPNLFAALANEADSSKLPLGKPHFAPKAKRVIYRSEERRVGKSVDLCGSCMFKQEKDMNITLNSPEQH